MQRFPPFRQNEAQRLYEKYEQARGGAELLRQLAINDLERVYARHRDPLRIAQEFERQAEMNWRFELQYQSGQTGWQWNQPPQASFAPQHNTHNIPAWEAWCQSEQASWQSAWDRYLGYEADRIRGLNTNMHPSDWEILNVRFWPTRLGEFLSCNEAEVREFFHHRPGGFNRSMMLDQARRWHPDHAMVLFDQAQDQEVVRRTVTEVTQVINSMLGRL